MFQDMPSKHLPTGPSRKQDKGIRGHCSLAKPKVFELLNMNGKASQYTLKTCSGMIQARGRRTGNLIIESLDGTQSHSLPMLTECEVIPDSREFQLQLLLKSTLI